ASGVSTFPDSTPAAGWPCAREVSTPAAAPRTIATVAHQLHVTRFILHMENCTSQFLIIVQAHLTRSRCSMSDSTLSECKSLDLISRRASFQSIDNRVELSFWSAALWPPLP